MWELVKSEGKTVHHRRTIAAGWLSVQAEGEGWRWKLYTHECKPFHPWEQGTATTWRKARTLAEMAAEGRGLAQWDERVCPSCLGSCRWVDTHFVCRQCGDEWEMN